MFEEKAKSDEQEQRDDAGRDECVSAGINDRRTDEEGLAAAGADRICVASGDGKRLPAVRHGTAAQIDAFTNGSG